VPYITLASVPLAKIKLVLLLRPVWTSASSCGGS